MKQKTRTPKISSEMELVVRKRNQVTLPQEVVDRLDLHEGDVVIVGIQNGTAVLRPVRRSYAGIAKGLYGDAFLESERSEWR